MDFCQGMPEPVLEYYIILIPQSDIPHGVHMHQGRALEVAPPTVTKFFPRRLPGQAISAVSQTVCKTIPGPMG